MDRGVLLSKIKNVRTDEGRFTLIIGASSDYEKEEIMKQAKWLQSEMYIILKTCEVQKAMKTEGVVLSGRILDL